MECLLRLPTPYVLVDKVVFRDGTPLQLNQWVTEVSVTTFHPRYASDVPNTVALQLHPGSDGALPSSVH
jgi:hypothetical protein